MTNNSPDPAAIYLHIYNRLLECQQMGEKMPSAEASQSFQQLMIACDALIRENSRLQQAVSISDQIVEELEIELCVKDIELFNFTTQTQEKDDKNP